MRLTRFGAVAAEILDRVMQRVGRQRPFDALAFELLRAHLGTQMHRDASSPAMLIERAGAHAGASQAQHHRSAIVAGRGEEFALEAVEAHRALAPSLTRALC
jgi:hypothetical protein